MKVIYGKEQAEEFGDKYIVLELDTFMVGEEPLTAYCVIGAEDVSLGQMTEIDHWKKFHADFIHGYKTQQWSFCLDCIINLRGKFGTLNSFYDEMDTRIKGYDENGVSDGWTPVVIN